MTTKKNILKNIIKDKIFVFFVIVLSIMSIIPLILILYFILFQGIKYVNLDLLSSLPKPPGEVGGGVVNGIIGTLIIIIMAILISAPIGIMCGIYLAENKKSKLSEFTRLIIDILQGVPSIIIGIVVYILVVVPMKSFSAISGSIALAIVILPVIIKNTEESVKLIPNYLKEAAYSLGVPYYKIILKVLLPASLSGIVTGLLVGMARSAGETAPLLFTAFGNPFMNLNILKPMETLPHIIFKYSTSPYIEWQNIAWGAATILIIFVLVINLITKVVVNIWKVKF